MFVVLFLLLHQHPHTFSLYRPSSRHHRRVETRRTDRDGRTDGWKSRRRRQGMEGSKEEKERCDPHNWARSIYRRNVLIGRPVGRRRCCTGTLLLVLHLFNLPFSLSFFLFPPACPPVHRSPVPFVASFMSPPSSLRFPPFLTHIWDFHLFDLS